MSNLLEEQFQTKWYEWFKENKSVLPERFCVEFKVTNGGTFSVKAWREGKQSHQIGNLINCTNDIGTYHKIADTGYTNPFDAFFICNADAFLVIYFNKYKEFFIIPIQEVPFDQTSISYDWCKERYTGHRLLVKRRGEVIDF